MSPRRLAVAALPLLAGAWGCASTAPCAVERTCGAASWMDQGGVIEGRLVLAPVSDVAAAGSAGQLGAREVLTLRQGATLLRFDLTSLEGATGIERAVLALSPHESWRVRGQGMSLVARAVLGGWSPVSVAEGVTPGCSSSPVAQVTLPASARAPVRLEVTELVRAWLAGTLPAEGLSLETSGGEARFQGGGALALADRPRLEVVLR